MPKVIPVFLPQTECPYKCTFCNQSITVGKVANLSAEDIEKQIINSLKSIPPKAEKQLAFYGGSFTCLPVEKQIEYLSKPYESLKAGKIDSIRISTRPDVVNEKIVKLLKEYSVKIVELGVQILDDDILRKIKRGHTVHDIENAVKLLKENSFKLGLQLMVGLPGETDKRRGESWKKVLHLKPDMLRIHPTIVLKNTELAKAYNEGKYAPLTIEEAVDICTDMLIESEINGIEVLRLGLQSSMSLQEPGAIVAGPWHPAFGQLVKGELYYRLITNGLKNITSDRYTEYSITIPDKEISNVFGLNKKNIERWKRNYPDKNISFIKSRDIKKYEVIIETDTGRKNLTITSGSDVPPDTTHE